MENHKTKLETNDPRWDKGVCPLGVWAQGSHREGRACSSVASRARRVWRSANSCECPSSQ